MLDSTHFGQISDVLISVSVRYRWWGMRYTSTALYFYGADIELSAHLWSKVVSIDISLFKPPNALLYNVFCMGISNDQC